MPRGRRTSYTRDNRGRFASSPGGGAPKRSTPASRRAATRAGNRLNRDNSGRISGIGRDGAAVRGGRLKTAQGNRRATQLASMRPAGFRAGTIAKGGRGVRGMVARSLAAARKERVGQRLPAAQRPGSLTSTLRGTLRTVAKADAARIRELEAITGAKIRPTAAGARAAGEAGARVRGAAKGGKVGATLRAGLRELAQSDARTAREMASIVRDATPKVAGAKGGKAIRGGRAALPGGKPAAAKQQPQKPSKKPANKAQRAYLAARSNARARGGDLQGPDARSRRMASSAAAVVKGMERRRSGAVPKAPADSPRARQQQRQAARAQRAVRNQRAAMAREADGPGSKASRSATVARRAQQIYAGKVDPKAKTKSRLTKTRDPEVLRKRIAKIKDNTARAAAKAAKASAKPAKPVNNKPKRSLAVRVAKADKADKKLKAQLKQAIASGNEKKIIELNFRRRRIDRFSETYNFADLKASRKALTPAKPTAPKRTRAARPAGTVAKPRGMRPGVLAGRRGANAKPSIPGFAPKDFERRASRAFYNTKNPKVKDRALALYKQMMDTSMTPLQVKKLMTTGKSYSTVKNKPKPARQRLSKGEREHRDMLALAGKLFR